MGKKFYNPAYDGVWPIVSAQTHAGAAYTGTMRIAPAEGDGHRIDWKTSAGNYDGIGLVIDGRLMLAFGNEDDGYGLAIYTEVPAGIEAVFTSQAFKGSVGRETVVGCPGFGQLDRTYDMEGWQPDKIAYKGKVAFVAYGDLFLLTWAFDGERGILQGVGMLRHGKLITSYSIPNVFTFGSGCYELQPDGTLRGEWAIPVYKTTAREVYGVAAPLVP